MKKIIFLGIAMFLVPRHLNAQGTDFRFNYISLEDGLSQSTVQTIHQDSEGYMWFGTQDGLNKYDGYNITVFKSESNDPNSLSNDDVRVVYEDRRENLWIGTQSRGLNLYDREKNHFVRFIGIDEDWETLSDNTVWAILEDSHETLWIGTAYGLNIMDRETQKFARIFSEPDDPGTLTHNQINSLYETEDGTVWVGTSNGLNKLNREDQSFTRYLHNDSQHGAIYVRTIYEDRRGTLWIGTEEDGLFYLNRNSDEFHQFEHNPNDVQSISDDAVYAILEDSRGNLWIGTGNSGLNIFDQQQEVFYRYHSRPEIPYSLNNNGVNSLYESSDGVLWAGTFAGGVNFIDPAGNRFLHYQHNPMNRESLSNNSVLSFTKDQNGQVWIGTDGGGLNLFNPENGTFQHFINDPEHAGQSPSSDVILDMHETDDGIWLGTYGGGIDLFNPQTHTFQNFRLQSEDSQSLTSDYVFVIRENSNGELWFGTNWGGVNIMNNPEDGFKHFMADPDDPDNNKTINNNDIREIFEDQYGDVWIGSYGGYLTRYTHENSLFNTYSVNTGQDFYSNVVQNIIEDQQNRLWLGTRGGGLKLFDRDTNEITSYTTEDGLSSNIVHAIIEDEHGTLWLSTNNGISRFDPGSEIFINYNTDHGIQGREFNPRAAYRDDEGFIYFGGVNGFNTFHPDSIKIDTLNSPVVLTDFLIFNRGVPIGGDSPLEEHISQTEVLVLPHTASVISFGFSALNFSSIKGNRFAYKLEGFEENWNYVGEQRQATYTNLNPGEYKFRVIASNRDDLWNEDGAALTLVITPPFWKTGWFISIMVLALGGFVFLAYRLRIKAIKRQNRHLAGLISDRTSELKTANATKEKLLSVIAHDLNNSAAGMIGLAEILKDSIDNERMDEVRNYIELLYQSSGRFASLLKNLLTWARSQAGHIQYNPNNFSIAKITEIVIDQEESRAFNKKINLHHMIDPELEVFADKDMITVVLRNLVQNALKFTEKNGRVVVEASEHDNFVEISVEDNGTGMDEETQKKIFSEGQHVTKQGTSEEKGSGLGLPLCVEFVQKNNGNIRAKSEPGKGTTIFFTLPVKHPVTEEAITYS
ncbi:MAG: two-component regulator propeller domain-containing protein [Balneolaceae bacterium]